MKTHKLAFLMMLACIAPAVAALSGTCSPPRGNPVTQSSSTPQAGLATSFVFAEYEDVDEASLGWPLLRTAEKRFGEKLLGTIENYKGADPIVFVAYGSGSDAISMIERELPVNQDNCWSELGVTERIGELDVHLTAQDGRSAACFFTGVTSDRGKLVAASAVSQNADELRRLLASLSRP